MSSKPQYPGVTSPAALFILIEFNRFFINALSFGSHLLTDCLVDAMDEVLPIDTCDFCYI